MGHLGYFSSLGGGGGRGGLGGALVRTRLAQCAPRVGSHVALAGRAMASYEERRRSGAPPAASLQLRSSVVSVLQPAIVHPALLAMIKRKYLSWGVGQDSGEWEVVEEEEEVIDVVDVLPSMLAPSCALHAPSRVSAADDEERPAISMPPAQDDTAHFHRNDTEKINIYDKDDTHKDSGNDTEKISKPLSQRARKRLNNSGTGVPSLDSEKGCTALDFEKRVKSSKNLNKRIPAKRASGEGGGVSPVCDRGSEIVDHEVVSVPSSVVSVHKVGTIVGDPSQPSDYDQDRSSDNRHGQLCLAGAEPSVLEWQDSPQSSKCVSHSVPPSSILCRGRRRAARGARARARANRRVSASLFLIAPPRMR